MKIYYLNEMPKLSCVIKSGELRAVWSWKNEAIAVANGLTK